MTNYQRALITGASSGIGLALAHQFAKNNTNLIVVSEDAAELAHAAANIRATYPVEVREIVKDLSQPGGADELYEEVLMLETPVDVLVNDAGVGRSGPFVETPLEEYSYMIRLNIDALTTLTRLYLPAMVASGHGGIINLGSIAGFQPGPLLGVYHATKAYVVSLSEALAEELKDTEITVTCICPGPTATHFFQRARMENTWVVKHSNYTMMDPFEVAEGGYEAFMNRERVYIPGAVNKTMTFIRRILPNALQAKMNKTFYETAENE